MPFVRGEGACPSALSRAPGFGVHRSAAQTLDRRSGRSRRRVLPGRAAGLVVLWRRKGEMWYFALMAVRSCRVTVQDLEGIAHTVEVTAESLFEAVAQGLAALRRSDWVAGFQQGVVKVSVADVPVEHQVKLTDFTQWLERRGRSPREVFQRQELRSILGMPTQS